MPAVTYSGDPVFSSTELLAASGVAAGASLDQAGMQAAAQRLNDSGMFATVRFSFNGRELHYELTPVTNLLPARFDNFPWWDEKDLSTQLSSKVPLFHGEAAPESGTERKVIDALTAMRAGRQVEAKIAATPSLDQATGNANALVFHITNPLVQIGQLKFNGATAEWTDRLAEINKAASKVDYSATETPATLIQAVQRIYRDRQRISGGGCPVGRGPAAGVGFWSGAGADGDYSRAGRAVPAGTVLTGGISVDGSNAIPQ